MLLLLMAMTQKDLIKEALSTLSPTAEEIVAVREKLGLDVFQAACIASYKKAQNWQMTESGQSQMDEDRWVLFLLRAGIQKQLLLVDRATGLQPSILYPSRADQAALKKHQPSGGDLFELRTKLKKTQAEMCQFARIRFISNWGALESGVAKMSPEKFELLELQLGVHQQSEIKLRDERFSSVSSFVKAFENGDFPKTSASLNNYQIYGIKKLAKSL